MNSHKLLLSQLIEYFFLVDVDSGTYFHGHIFLLIQPSLFISFNLRLCNWSIYAKP